MSDDQLVFIADELRAIANQGLLFTPNPWDKERYERILAESARLLALSECGDSTEILAAYHQNLAHYSPNVGAEAAVFRDDKLLLVQRRDDGLWALPGGLVEVGETFAQGAERELREETGVSGQAMRLLGIFDSRVWRTRTRFHLYSAIFEVHSSDSPVPGSEVLAAEFFPLDTLPPLSQGHHVHIPAVLKLHSGEMPAPHYDRAGPASDIQIPVHVKQSLLGGQGMFASESVQAGSVVVIWGGQVFTEEEVRAGVAARHSCAAIDEGLYLGNAADTENGPDDYMNHSCDPNVWMQDAVTLVARRNIAAGEELTIDYALFESDPAWVADWECRCGSEQCRGRITGRDWERSELQAKYGNHFSPFNLRRIARQDAADR